MGPAHIASLIFLFLGFVLPALWSLVFSAYGGAALQEQRPVSVLLIALAMVGIALILYGIAYANRILHILHDVQQLSYKACLHCAYPLSALDPSETCPECGTPNDMKIVKHKWECVCVGFPLLRVYRTLPRWHSRCPRSRTGNSAQ